MTYNSVHLIWPIGTFSMLAARRLFPPAVAASAAGHLGHLLNLSDTFGALREELRQCFELDALW